MIFLYGVKIFQAILTALDINMDKECPYTINLQGQSSLRNLCDQVRSNI